ncbi:RHS repeat-associated core domain-containing protein, partial [Pseudomonas sp. ok272]
PDQARPFYYQLDHLGTPQELTDHRGEIVWSATYTAYGKLNSLNHFGGPPLEQPLRFQGQYFDPESGLHYNRHRYYNPATGRYLTPDPSKLAGGVNAYRYALNPTGWVDPLGLNTCPGGDGCRPANGPQDPAGKVGVDEGGPALPTIVHDVDPSTLKRTHAISGKSSTKNVENIAADMQKNGFDVKSPIDVVESGGGFYILDGHHRTLAARQALSRVSIRVIVDIKVHKGSLNTVDEVLESASNVGLDRLERRRR